MMLIMPSHMLAMFCQHSIVVACTSGAFDVHKAHASGLQARSGGSEILGDWSSAVGKFWQLVPPSEESTPEASPDAESLSSARGQVSSADGGMKRHGFDARGHEHSGTWFAAWVTPFGSVDGTMQHSSGQPAGGPVWSDRGLRGSARSVHTAAGPDAACAEKTPDTR